MRIRQLSRLMVGLSVLMLLAMGAVIVGLLDTQERITASERHRWRAHELADELLQSSEDLTRMARSYVATGDALFEQHYFEILDIRNGKRARPQHYAPTYWHLSGVGKAPAVPLEDPVSLQELMQREGVQDQEFALLHASQAESDALVALERQAFAAMKGLFADASGAYTVRRAPDPRLANNLLYSERYVEAKARIMAPIQKFSDAVEARNNERIDALRSTQRGQVLLLLALVGVTLLGLFGFARYNRRAVLVPLQRLGHHARNLLQGRYSTRISLRSGNELAELGQHFNAIAQSLEADVAQRELAEQAVEKAVADLAARELLLQQILDTSSVAIFLVNMDGRITHVNRRMSEMFTWTTAELEGKEYVDLIAPQERDIGRGLMLRLLAGEIPLTDVERRYRRADGSEFWGHLSGRRMVDLHGEKQGLVGVMVDITARKRADQRQQHHNRVLKLLAEKKPLADVLDAMVRDVESMEPGMLCSILLLDAQGQHLRHGAAPSLPAFYTQALDGVAIGVGVGSCGTAAFTGERVVVEDIASHPWWTPYRELAAQADLGACWSQPIVSAQGSILGTFAIYHRKPSQPTLADIDLIEDEARLAALVIEKLQADGSLQLAASVFSHAREGIIITDAKGLIVEVNQTFAEITGYTREEALGHNPRDLLNSGHHTREFYAARRKALDLHGFWSGEVWNRRKNGEVFAEMLTISVVRDAAGATANYVALFTDITRLKEHQRQLEHIAHFDSLTSLPNRVLLADRLQQALTQSQRRGLSVAVVYLDLDGFKAVNDTHGHALGDELLVALAHRMKAALRNGDTLSRIGGDEFVAVLVDLDAVADAEPVLQRLLQAAADPVELAHIQLQVSASIGVTIYPQDGSEVDLLLRHADQAMYVAKQAGKNRYHLFDVAQDTAVKTQRESLEHIRRALERQEFVLHYQPKVNMRTGAVIGAEALIRWQHPERGLLAPAAFLPTIENHAISVTLGEWVIGAALNQMVQWQAQGLEMAVSVNIGARQLQQDGFAQRLTELLARYPGVAPQLLELEILETSALEDLAQVFQAILACQGLGVRFALDDFGTGYSSLTHLRHLPAEVIKIDQSFVRDMLEDADDLAIVKGVIGLAAAFHREVIAEGVETSAHGKLLQELGCEMVQGYGIARPMPAADLPAWVGNWRISPVWIG
jgi:diguanylate cyclase (GGDEF)-like protein/PAS domain S-box-containing protein